MPPPCDCHVTLCGFRSPRWVSQSSINTTAETPRTHTHTHAHARTHTRTHINRNTTQCGHIHVATEIVWGYTVYVCECDCVCVKEQIINNIDLRTQRKIHTVAHIYWYMDFCVFLCYSHSCTHTHTHRQMTHTVTMVAQHHAVCDEQSHSWSAYLCIKVYTVRPWLGPQWTVSLIHAVPFIHTRLHANSLQSYFIQGCTVCFIWTKSGFRSFSCVLQRRSDRICNQLVHSSVSLARSPCFVNLNRLWILSLKNNRFSTWSPSVRVRGPAWKVPAVALCVSLS